MLEILIISLKPVKDILLRQILYANNRMLGITGLAVLGDSQPDVNQTQVFVLGISGSQELMILTPRYFQR